MLKKDAFWKIPEFLFYSFCRKDLQGVFES